MRSHPRPARIASRLLAPAFFAALALGSARASVSIPFPFTASFETGDGYGLGALSSDPVWSFSPGLAVEVSDMSFDGSQSLAYVGGAWLNLLPDAQSVAGGYPVTWVDFYLRPVFSDLTELPASLDSASATATGFVRVGADGEVYAVDGDGEGGGDWVASGKRVALLDDRAVDWMRISYRIDYGLKRWDLFLDGQLVLIDLGFADDSVSGFTRFSLRGDSTTSTLLDYFYAGDVNPLFADSNNDGLPDSWLQGHGLAGEVAGRDADPDRDGLRNITEYLLGLNPSAPDTDGDGVYDGREVARGTDPTVAQSVVLGSLPYADSFEADAPGVFLDGTRAWSITLGHETAASSVVAAPTGQADGLQSLSLAGRDLRLERQFAPASGNPVVWLDFLADLAARAVSAPELSADSAASFYLDEGTGQLMALDGSGGGGGVWQGVLDLAAPPSGSTAQASPPAFRRYTVRLDYAAQTWSLWVDGVRRADGFGFANAVPYFSGLTVDHDSGRAAGLDRLLIGTDEPAALDTDGDGLTNAEEASLGTNPESSDSDDDGILDKAELIIGTDPAVANGIAALLVQNAAGDYGWQTQFSSAEGYVAGYLAGQLGWGAAGESLVTEEAGRLSATTSDASIERTFGASHVNRVWIRFRAKLAPGQLPISAEVTGAVSGMFGYRSADRLAIFDGTTAQWVEFTVAATASEWNDYILYFDYVAKRWVLALNGVVVAKDLAFRDTAINHLARLRVLQEGSDTATEANHSEIDDIIVSSVPFAGLDLDGDGVLDTEEKALGIDPFAPDSDRDGIPDGWEVDHGLDPRNPTDALADIDNDGFSNRVEYEHGTDVAVASPGLPGYAHWDEWRDLTGTFIPDLTNHARFPGAPSTRQLLPGLELPAARGVNYGTRLRAWLLPPVTGNYTFWVAGDDNVELWLGSDQTPFGRRRIASTGGSTNKREWEKRPDIQRSVSITLQAGQRYYLELLHKQGGGGESLSTAWQIPGGVRELIAPAYIEAFPRFAGDQDDDGLSDAWEIAHGLNPANGSGIHGAYGDHDGDGLNNLNEFLRGLSPTAIDSDDDGASDFGEIELGTDPLNPSSSATLGPPPPWQSGSIGGKSFQWVAQSNGKVSVWTNSTPFNGKADAGGILYQTVEGNFSVDGSVWFPELSRTDLEGGMMIRDSLASDSPFVSITRTKNTGWVVRHRAMKGARVLFINLATNSPVSFTHFAMGRVGSVVSLYGRTLGGLTRKLADYPVNFAAQEAVLGYVAWTGSSSNPASMAFTVGTLVQANALDDIIGESDLSTFDSVTWMGEWDGLSAPLAGSVPEPSLLDLTSRDVRMETIAALPGSAAVGRVGSWSDLASSVAANDRRGELEWGFLLPHATMPLLELVLREAATGNTQPSHFPLKFYVDGHYIGSRTITVAPGATASGLWFAPWLGAGEHSLRIVWDGAADYTRLQIDSVTLRQVGGVDSDENGRPDWADRRLHLFNGIDASEVLESSVNPAPIEGRAQWAPTVSLTANGTALSVDSGAGYRWFSSVPLVRDQDTPMVYLGENGGVVRQLSARWTPHDVLLGGSLALRVGSRLLVSVGGGAESVSVSLSRNGVPVALGSGVAELEFPAAGVFTLSAQRVTTAGIESGTTIVQVYATPSLPAALPGLVQRERIITRPTLASGLVIDADPRLGLTTVPSNASQIAWQADDNVERTMVVRAGENGPILGRAPLPGTEVYATLDTHTRVLTVHPDGSMEVETLVIMSPRRADHAIRLEVFVAGVVFADGTLTKTLHLSDLDELGQATVRLILPPNATNSVCHRTHLVHLNGVIGTK